MTITSSVGDVEASLGAVADDLARASLALARRFQAGGTMWCASPAWPFHAHHVAVAFVHPVIVGKRALAAVTVRTGEGSEVGRTSGVETRAPGGLLLVHAGSAITNLTTSEAAAR